METITEIHDWSKCREQGTVRGRAPPDTSGINSTLNLAHGKKMTQKSVKRLHPRVPTARLCPLDMTEKTYL